MTERLWKSIAVYVPTNVSFAEPVIKLLWTDVAIMFEYRTAWNELRITCTDGILEA